MTKPRLPRIGLTLDAEKPGGYSAYRWYAMRTNYADAVAQAGGVPLALPHHADLAEAMLDTLDGLIVTGGAFDVSPVLYGAGEQHGSVTLKEGRTAAELALLRGALARDMPVLGICGGQQLLAVVLGGTLIQHIPDAIPNALPHEQPNPRHEAGHTVAITPGTQAACHRAACDRMAGELVAPPGGGAAPARAPVVNAVAPDGVIEGIEDAGYRGSASACNGTPNSASTAATGKLFQALIAAARP